MCQRREKKSSVDSLLAGIHRYVSFEKHQPTLYCPDGGLTVMETYREERNGEGYLMCGHCGQVFGVVEEAK